jgi:uncharacterized protein DUF2695
MRKVKPRRRRASKHVFLDPHDEALDVMTPIHPDWGEFIGLLRLSLDRGKCSNTARRMRSRRILRALGCNVERSLEFFVNRGGFCDCEVLLNVSERPRRGRMRKP